MKYTIIKDLQFYETVKEDRYAIIVLPKGTEVDILNKRQIRNLPYREREAIKRMRKRDRNILAFMWKGQLRTAVRNKDLVQTQVSSRASFCEGLLGGKN
jgi:hypothetical protein